MSDLMIDRVGGSVSQAMVLPPPRVGGGAVSIRLAKATDLKFIDDLQKKNNRSLGFASLGQLTKNIADGHVLIAEQPRSAGGTPAPLGYCIAKDRYKEHEDVGIVYQLAIVEGQRRGLIGATLIKAVFDRAAYGCKLFCCWCAQDLEANHFWESIGFVPLAFRTGSRKVRYKDGTSGPRIHIFWQRRIREGDEATPYWFPSETRGGAVKENRLVLPIPPDTHWSDAKPAVLPGVPGMEHVNSGAVLPPGAQDASGDVKKQRPRNEKKVKVVVKRNTIAMGGLRFAPPAAAKQEKVKQPKPPREKFRNDPKMVEAARELRDRYIEQINAGLLLPPSANGKYEVSRQLEAAPTVCGSIRSELAEVKIEQVKLLNAA